MRTLVGSFLLVTMIFAGCVETPPELADVEPIPVVARTNLLQGALEPAEFLAPIFEKRATVFDNVGGGEPSVWVHLDGTIYVNYPGCGEGASACVNGPVYRSDDEGKTWKFLNNADGSLSKKNKPANGDADIAVDAAGRVYSTDLGPGIEVFASDDRGESWQYAGNVGGSDRQWVTAGKAGQVLISIRGGDTGSKVEVVTSVNGGKDWSDTTYLGTDVTVQGPITLDVEGERAFVPFIQPLGNPGASGLYWFAAPEYEMLLGRSLDAGATWEVVKTGVEFPKSLSGLHWPGTLIFPGMDITGDGRLVLVYAVENNLPGAVVSQGVDVMMVTSPDWGTTWTTPVKISSRSAAVLPWVTAGAGDRVAVTYYASDAMSDSDKAVNAVWDVMATYIDGVGEAQPTLSHVVVDAGIHEGSLCTTGTGCAVFDRSLLDFFESDLLPDGRLAIVYAADPANRVPGDPFDRVEVRFAVQTGGTPLLELLPGSLPSQQAASSKP